LLPKIRNGPNAYRSAVEQLTEFTMTDLLTTTPHLDAPDDFYEALIDAHRDLSAAESHALNARLVLLLANHIGALPVLREALAAARASAPA
jgi:Protein of unknown function (DUF2783)